MNNQFINKDEKSLISSQLVVLLKTVVCVEDYSFSFLSQLKCSANQSARTILVILQVCISIYI